MGPMAGIGDTIVWGTIRPIVFSFGITLAMAGSVWGGLIPFAFAFICLALGYVLYMFGYRVGRESVQTMLQSGMIKDVIPGSSILGLFMMGALGASYVKLSIPIEIVMENADTMVVQDILDSIIPGMLPLAAIMLIYLYFDKKEQAYNKILIFILIISLAGSFVGLF